MTTTPQKHNAKHDSKPMVFAKQNYILMIAAIAVIILGFILMSGTTDIYDFRKITVAPIVVLLGFGLGVYAIMKKQ